MRVLAEQTSAVDLQRSGEPAGHLSIDELRQVDAALRLVLGLGRASSTCPVLGSPLSMRPSPVQTRRDRHPRHPSVPGPRAGTGSHAGRDVDDSARSLAPRRPVATMVRSSEPDQRSDHDWRIRCTRQTVVSPTARDPGPPRRMLHDGVAVPAAGSSPTRRAGKRCETPQPPAEQLPAVLDRPGFAARLAPTPAGIRQVSSTRPQRRSTPTADQALRRPYGRATVRHALVIALATSLLLAFWASRPEWSPEMRLWRAVGDAAVVLLLASLAIGPLARLSGSAGWLVAWRRQIGIWAAVLASAHSLLILDGWARWSVRRFLGYELVPQLGREARMEPGFGLANLVGLVALVWLLILLATSSDRALRFLGPAAWKWVHQGAYVVFYLVLLHSAYFLFLHYTVSFHRAPAPENWFRWPLLLMGLVVLGLQWLALWRTMRRRRERPGAVARRS